MKFGRIATITTLASMLFASPAAWAQDEGLDDLGVRRPPAKRMTAAEEELNDPARKGPFLGAGAVFAMENFDSSELGGMGVSDSGAYNVRVGYRFMPYLATELHIERYVEFDGPDGNGADDFEANGWTVGGNARGYLLTGKYQPFLMLGVNYLDMEVRGSDPASGITDKTHDGFAMRFGGGAEIYVTQKIALTGDISYLLGIGETDGFDIVAFSLGFIFRP